MAVELRCETTRGRRYARGMRSDAQALMRLLGLEACELSMLIVGDRAIRTLNRRFRGKDRPTDVLSFPQQDGPAAGGPHPRVTALAKKRKSRAAHPLPGQGEGQERSTDSSLPPFVRSDEGARNNSQQVFSSPLLVQGEVAAALRKQRTRRARAGADSLDVPLGDIVISIDTALRQARQLHVTPDDRIRTLLIHGLLHLLGYDHERSASEARRMFARERELAAALRPRR